MGGECSLSFPARCWRFFSRSGSATDIIPSSNYPIRAARLHQNTCASGMPRIAAKALARSIGGGLAQPAR